MYTTCIHAGNLLSPDSLLRCTCTLSYTCMIVLIQLVYSTFFSTKRSACPAFLPCYRLSCSCSSRRVKETHAAALAERGAGETGKKEGQAVGEGGERGLARGGGRGTEVAGGAREGGGGEGEEGGEGKVGEGGGGCKGGA